MWQKLESVNVDRNLPTVEFEYVGDQTNVQIDTSESIGGYTEVSTDELVDLLEIIKFERDGKPKDESWIEPMSLYIQEILSAYKICSPFHDDEMLLNSITLELLHVIEVFKNTGNFPDKNLFQDVRETEEKK
jgi:hypothetical protein